MPTDNEKRVRVIFLEHQIATRGCEEIIALLVAKGIVKKTDLSAELLRIVNERRQLRSQPPL